MHKRKANWTSFILNQNFFVLKFIALKVTPLLNFSCNTQTALIFVVFYLKNLFFFVEMGNFLYCSLSSFTRIKLEQILQSWYGKSLSCSTTTFILLLFSNNWEVLFLFFVDAAVTFVLWNSFACFCLLLFIMFFSFSRNIFKFVMLLLLLLSTLLCRKFSLFFACKRLIA